MENNPKRPVSEPDSPELVADNEPFLLDPCPTHSFLGKIIYNAGYFRNNVPDSIREDVLLFCKHVDEQSQHLNAPINFDPSTSHILLDIFNNITGNCVNIKESDIPHSLKQHVQQVRLQLKALCKKLDSNRHAQQIFSKHHEAGTLPKSLSRQPLSKCVSFAGIQPQSSQFLLEAERTLMEKFNTAFALLIQEQIYNADLQLQADIRDLLLSLKTTWIKSVNDCDHQSLEPFYVIATTVWLNETVDLLKSEIPECMTELRIARTKIQLSKSIAVARKKTATEQYLLQTVQDEVPVPLQGFIEETVKKVLSQTDTLKTPTPPTSSNRKKKKNSKRKGKVKGSGVRRTLGTRAKSVKQLKFEEKKNNSNRKKSRKSSPQSSRE